MDRPSWLLLGVGLIASFSAGAMLQGAVGVGVGMLAAGAFSVIVGVTVTAPASKRAVFTIVTSDEPEDVTMRREFVATLAAEAALAFDAEKALPAGSARPVTALLERMADSFLVVARHRQAQLKGQVTAEARAAGYTDSQILAAERGEFPQKGGDYGTRWAAVQQAAERAGRPIPDGLKAKVESAMAIGEIVGSVFGESGKNGGSSLTPAKRVPKPVDASSGYAW